MQVIKFKMRDYAYLQLTECSPHIVQEMSDFFTFEVEGAKYMPIVKQRKWDGKIRLLDRNTGQINAGLYWSIRRFALDRGYTVEIEPSKYGYPYDKNKVNHMQTMRWLANLNLPFKPRDYQYDAFTYGVQNKRCVIVSPTGSGKSFIVYLLMRWYLENHEEKVLIIVPTTSLVEQLYSDFTSYGYDSNIFCHRIYSGKDKETEKRVIISTWQSIYKLHPNWFHQFGAIFGDEVHGFKAKSLSSIMNKSKNAQYRWGATGSLDGSQVNELVLEGLFAPVYRVTTTAKLQEKKQLAQLNIDIIQLQYGSEIRKRLKDAKYHEEIDFIVSNESRNKFIRNLACSLEGNTLVLFNLVEKHGKVLRDLIEPKLKEGRRLYYVSGETKTSDREAVRGLVEKQTNSIVLASLGTFSTGINIRNIHNIIFASPSKSQIRVLQSIGRGLRISDNGESTRLYDIADDLRYENKPNFTLRHSAERIKIYKNEEFNYTISQVVLNAI